MHFEKYFKKKKINQLILNKKINWFFDIKSILYKNYSNKQVKKFASEIEKNIKEIKKISKNKIKKKINLKKINFQKLNKIDGGKKIKKIIDHIYSNNLLDYFEHFIVQGSVASYDFINTWSDFDTLVVIKDEVLRDKIKLVQLRKKIKKLYKYVKQFSKLQHHGLIFYTNFDLKNYLSGYLPPEALKFNFSLIEKKFIEFQVCKNNKKNLSKRILFEKRDFFKNSLKKNTYNHHVIGKKIPRIPFKKNDPYMFELFYNFGSILNIPILYFDARGKSIHKKDSFKKFYKEFKIEEVINFIKKHENLRKNWKKYKFKNFSIPQNLIEKLEKNYIDQCLKVFQIVCKKLS